MLTKLILDFLIKYILIYLNKSEINKTYKKLKKKYKIIKRIIKKILKFSKKQIRTSKKLLKFFYIDKIIYYIIWFLFTFWTFIFDVLYILAYIYNIWFLIDFTARSLYMFFYKNIFYTWLFQYYYQYNLLMFLKIYMVNFFKYLLHKIIDLLACFYNIPLTIIFLTLFFFNFLEYTTSKRKNLNSYNLKIKSIIGKSFSYNFFSKLNLLIIILPILFIIISKNYVYKNNSNEFLLNNNKYSIIVFILIIVLLLYSFILNLREVSFNNTNNLVLTLLLLLIPFIYIYNSILYLFFFIEIINISLFIIILCSILSSNFISNKKKKLLNSFSVNSNKLSNKYMYGIFIYYWFSFFFSFIFFLFLINISYNYNFIDLNVLSIYIPLLNNKNISTDLISILYLLLLTIKFGLPPIHNQKLNIYKGLNLPISLIYTIITIISYFFIFSNIIFIVPTLFNKLFLILKITLIMNILVLLLNIFKELNIKAFFGYSSILTITTLYLILILN